VRIETSEYDGDWREEKKANTGRIASRGGAFGELFISCASYMQV
jgi:hypothetical protein